jgi:hypothetical protein
MSKLPFIEIGYDVFLGDGADAFGAVRDIVPDGRPVLVVNVENAGDVQIPLDAVTKVASKKVLVDWAQLDPSVQEAIRHTLDKEDFPPPNQEVDLELASDDDEDEDVRRVYQGPRVASPADELPGRDAGAELFNRRPGGK